MEKKDVLKRVDHTLLSQKATWEEIREILDDAMKYETASACIPAAYVKRAAEYVDGKLAICTVIGFPNGYSTTAAKVFEAKDAVENGAKEIDMVINVGYLKDKKYEELEEENVMIHFPDEYVPKNGELFPPAKQRRVEKPESDIGHF